MDKNIMTVKNITSKSGNKIANQFVLEREDTLIFQSYESTIATVDFKNHVVALGEDWDYSVTTGKYRNIFFSDYAYISELATKKGIEHALKTGSCGEWSVYLMD